VSAIGRASSIGYASERDPAAAVLMVNPKQDDISSAYVQQVIVGHPSYVPGTYRRRPLEPQSDRLTHFSANTMTRLDAW